MLVRRKDVPILWDDETEGSVHNPRWDMYRSVREIYNTEIIETSIIIDEIKTIGGTHGMD